MIKDWEKIGNNEWKDGLDIIRIEKNNKKWSVEHRAYIGYVYITIFTKDFKTKSQALKFIRGWVRKN